MQRLFPLNRPVLLVFNCLLRHCSERPSGRGMAHTHSKELQ